jgi:hypothetical protein
MLGAAAFAGLLALLYFASVHAGAGDSDGSTAILAGQSIGHGNVLLHGWVSGFDSFWTIDDLFYALATLIFGLRPGLLHAVPALLAALTVVVGILIARDGRRGGAAIAAGATVVAILAFPTHTMSYFFLRGPLHIGTALWALIAFLALRRNRFGLGWVVAVVFLAAGLLGDLETVAYATTPVFLGGIIAMLRRRSWRAGRVAVSASVAGVILGVLVRETAVAIGSFKIVRGPPRARFSQMEKNVRMGLNLGEQLLGVKNSAFGTGGVPIWLQRVHVLGAAALLVCFVAAASSLVWAAVTGRQARYPSTVEEWRLDDLLVLAVVGCAITFVVQAFASGAPFGRYLTASVIFAAILAARVIGRWWGHIRWPSARAGLAGVGMAAMLCFAAGVGYNLSVPRPTLTDAKLSSWLVSHHLNLGVGDYWASSITTVQSRGAVEVRPVVIDPAGRLIAYNHGPLASWFSGRRFQFLVFSAPEAFGSVDLATARATWGAPTHVYVVGPYDVVVWGHPIMARTP